VWLVGADDGPDDGLEGNLPAVAVPPLGLAEMAGRERQVSLGDQHLDRDELTLLAGRTNGV
jgi:hypothetical protein